MPELDGAASPPNKISSQNTPYKLGLSPRISQCMRQFFVKRPKVFAATSNLRVEQNLVRLGRFLHFSQKVVGVTVSTLINLINGKNIYT